MDYLSSSLVYAVSDALHLNGKLVDNFFHASGREPIHAGGPVFDFTMEVKECRFDNATNTFFALVQGPQEMIIVVCAYKHSPVDANVTVELYICSSTDKAPITPLKDIPSPNPYQHLQAIYGPSAALFATREGSSTTFSKWEVEHAPS